jgi:hypothetical protein
MRWYEAALAARRGMRRRLGLAVLAAAACLVLAAGGSAAPTVPNARGGVFAGYGFESCNAPSIDELTAWLASA